VSEPPTADHEKPSLDLPKSKEKVKDVDFLLVSSSHSMMSVGDLEIPITRTNMRLLTRMKHREREELGVNHQGITQPSKVVHEHQFVGSRYSKGE